MNKKKNGRETATLASASTGHRRRIMVIVSIGIILVLTELFCIPWVMPKRIIFTQRMHGDLISPPTETNFATSAGTSSVTQTPAYETPPDGVMRGTMATGGPRAYMGTPIIHIDTTKTNEDGYLQIGFNQLADFQIKVVYQIIDPVLLTTTPRLNRRIPDYIKSIDNRKIALRGFMLPLKWENGSVREFLLMRSRAFCCFGKTLEINELAYVRMNGDGVQSLMDQPLTVYGTFHVGEIIQHGRLNGIYRLDATKMDELDYR